MSSCRLHQMPLLFAVLVWGECLLCQTVSSRNDGLCPSISDSSVLRTEKALNNRLLNEPVDKQLQISKRVFPRVLILDQILVIAYFHLVYIL